MRALRYAPLLLVPIAAAVFPVRPIALPAWLASLPRPIPTGAGGVVDGACFGPEGRCGAFVVSAIARASTTVLVQAYTFSARDITSALLDARRRGCSVAVILDAGESRREDVAIAQLRSAGVAVYLDGAHSIAHNKVLLLDDELLTGSFNLTTAAERYSAENVIAVRGDVVESYRANWLRHRDHSTRVE